MVFLRPPFVRKSRIQGLKNLIWQSLGAKIFLLAYFVKLFYWKLGCKMLNLFLRNFPSGGCTKYKVTSGQSTLCECLSVHVIHHSGYFILM